MTPSKTPIAVLISGSGSNLQALIDACAAAGYPAEIRLVISNTADAFGLERARKAGIATQVISHTEYDSREAFDAALHAALIEARVELVCLAGFMRILTADFVQQWHGRMLNIHPSLLPDFKGAHAMRDALAAGATKSGCTVHYVVPEMDAGEVILQAEVPIDAGETEETLAQKIHAQEHRIYPEALRNVIETLDCI